MIPDLQAAWEISLLALLLWREAQNQTDEVITMVACSVRNRVLKPRWWGHDWISVILDSAQYSSFNRNDANATKIPLSGDAVFPRCLAIAAAVHDLTQADTSNGADSYYDKSLDADPPVWSQSPAMLHVLDAGDFHFYRAADRAVSA